VDRFCGHKPDRSVVSATAERGDTLVVAFRGAVADINVPIEAEECGDLSSRQLGDAFGAEQP
jgi:hypothetical protein